MIKFSRSETKVIIRVEHGIFHNDDYFGLEINQGHDYQAELLRKAFQENLDRHLTKIKQEFYDQGWKDAKAKIKKRTYFWGGW